MMDNRIVAALPTLKYLLEQKPKAIVLFSHLGKVKTEEDKAGKSLAPVAKRLGELLGKEVTAALNEKIKANVAALKEKDDTNLPK